MKRPSIGHEFALAVLAVVVFIAAAATGIGIWANHDAHVKCARIAAISKLAVRVHLTTCQIEVAAGVWVDAP